MIYKLNIRNFLHKSTMIIISQLINLIFLKKYNIKTHLKKNTKNRYIIIKLYYIFSQSHFKESKKKNH